MLKEASISEVRSKGIPKESRVLVNRGRGNDELAPHEDLFRDFDSSKKQLERDLGKGSAEAHNKAFVASDYERRFRQQVATDPRALTRLEELARNADREDIYLVCYEGPTKACHRRLLLRIAEKRFGAQVEIVGVEPK